jgi:hypothetical protein
MAGGSDWYLGFTVYSVVNGVKTPVDLTGYTAKLQMRLNYADITPVLALTDGAGITLGGSAGTILCHATPTQVANIPSEVYFLGLHITSAGGVTYSIIEQTITRLETAVS